ncbi:hypothetical protein ACWC2K_16260 [Streptomyces chattanoogensis]|uniref:hypothetical protein n=1 Tax=Streptomyces chattanoogensis TaxID=66876 RepID=UPI003688884A
MKLRHVRAVAACALVVVALTGARHSHGGGCSSHSSSSSSSGSTSGEYSSSSSSGGYSSSGSTTSSGTTGGSPTASATTPAESDVRITECKVDSAAGTLSAKLSITNGSAQGTASYNGSVRFTDASGGYVGTAYLSSVDVAAGQTYPASVTGTFIKGPGQQGALSGKCSLGLISKLNR